MIKLLSLILVAIFIYVFMYGEYIYIDYPCRPSVVHQLGRDTYFVGSFVGERNDYVGVRINNLMKWTDIEKSVNTKTCCACSYLNDENKYDIFIGRTDGIFLDSSNGTTQLVAQECSPTSICIADYFGDGRPVVFVSVVGGKNIFLVRENGKWVNLAHQYQLELDGDTKNAMFVKFSDDALPDLVCLATGKLFIYPNSAKKIEQPIQLDAPGFINYFCVADFGNTGNQSIAINATGGIYVFYGLGDRKFSEVKKIHGLGFSIKKFAVCDVNNDGRVDIIGNYVLLNRGESFTMEKKFHTKKFSVSMMVVDDREVIVHDDGKVRKNVFGNANRKYVDRNRSLKKANENYVCRYTNGDVLSIQNFIHSENSFPYYKIGNIKMLIDDEPKTVRAQ